MKNSHNPFVNAIYLGLRDWNVLAARATRPQFWFFVLAVVIFSSVAQLIAFLLDLPFVAPRGRGWGLAFLFWCGRSLVWASSCFLEPFLPRTRRWCSSASG